VAVLYFDNTGYSVDTDVAGMASGHDINFKAKNGAGTFRMYLVEANPSTGAVIQTFSAGTYVEILGSGDSLPSSDPDLSALTGTVSTGNTFGFKMTFQATLPFDGIADPEIKFGGLGTAKQLLFNVSETVAITPLTSVSNTPSPNTVGDTSTHTVAFTTVDTLPSDGKIVVTFPAGFNLAAVVDGDISSTTMPGSSFTVFSIVGQELTISHSGAAQTAAAEDIVIANITNTNTVGTGYLVTLETRDTGGTPINGPTTSGAFTIKGKSVLANPDTQVADQLGNAAGTTPTNVALVGFNLTPTGEDLTWTNLTVSLDYGGTTMADSDITNARIYIDSGTVGTYDGSETQVGAQSVSAAGNALTWNNVAGSVTAATATHYLIVFDAFENLSVGDSVQATVTAAGITGDGATTGALITTTGDVTDEPLHTVATSATVSGTITPSVTESDIVAGGETIIIDLNGDTWVPDDGTFEDTVRQAIIDGLDSAQSEGTGWNAEVRDKQGVAGVVRTSDTRVTITLDGQAGYSINADETITVTVPARGRIRWR
jgi:hypothetical protein